MCNTTAVVHLFVYVYVHLISLMDRESFIHFVDCQLKDTLPVVHHVTDAESATIGRHKSTIIILFACIQNVIFTFIFIAYYSIIYNILFIYYSLLIFHIFISFTFILFFFYWLYMYLDDFIFVLLIITVLPQYGIFNYCNNIVMAYFPIITTPNYSMHGEDNKLFTRMISTINLMLKPFTKYSIMTSA